MKKEYKDKFPEFCSDNGYYDLCLSDDSDSLLVNNFLEIQTWNSTRFFYDFNMLYVEKGYEQQYSMIGCDIDFIKGRCWGNHITAISSKDIINTNSANLNSVAGITSRNYTDKYAGSTLATVLSYYNHDISNLSEQAKMLLMCIDSHYIGFYSDRFHNTQKKWLVEVLQYPELYDIILKYKEQDFIDLAVSLNIKIPKSNGKYRDGKIWVNSDGYLETEINLKGISDILGTEITLPKTQFEPYFTRIDEEYLTLKTGYANTSNLSNRDQIQKNMFSYSQTYKNSASYTYLHKVKP